MTKRTPQGPFTEGREAMVTLSLFDSERDNAPKPWSGTLGALLGEEHAIREEKAGAPCVSFTVYDEGAKRSNANVRWQTAIGLDLDHVTGAQLDAAWVGLSVYAGAMYTTHSDRAGGPDDRCARLIALPTRWMTPREARIVRAALETELGVAADPHAVDPARLWYMPACPRSRLDGAFVRYSSGVPLDPDDLLAAAKGLPTERKEVQIINPVTVWQSMVIDGVAEGGRNMAVTRIAGYLLRKGIDGQVALHLLLGWNSSRNSPPLPASEVIAIINSVAGRELLRRGGRNAG